MRCVCRDSEPERQEGLGWGRGRPWAALVYWNNHTNPWICAERNLNIPEYSHCTGAVRAQDSRGWLDAEMIAESKWSTLVNLLFQIIWIDGLWLLMNSRKVSNSCYHSGNAERVWMLENRWSDKLQRIFGGSGEQRLTFVRFLKARNCGDHLSLSAGKFCSWCWF